MSVHGVSVHGVTVRTESLQLFVSLKPTHVWQEVALPLPSVVLQGDIDHSDPAGSESFLFRDPHQNRKRLQASRSGILK